MGRAAGGGRQRLWLARLGLVLHKRGSKSKLSVTRCCSEAASVAEQRILRQASLSTTRPTPHSKPLRSFLQRSPGTLISTIAAMAHQTSGYCACEKTSLSRNRACFGYAFCASAARELSSWLAIGFRFFALAYIQQRVPNLAEPHQMCGYPDAVARPPSGRSFRITKVPWRHGAQRRVM